MSERGDVQQQKVLEAAMDAALKALEAVTDTAEAAGALWLALAAEMFTDQLRLADDAGAAAFAALVNARLARDYVPWRVERVPVA